MGRRRDEVDVALLIQELAREISVRNVNVPVLIPTFRTISGHIIAKDVNKAGIYWQPLGQFAIRVRES